MTPIIKSAVIDKDARPAATTNTVFCFTSLIVTIPNLKKEQELYWSCIAYNIPKPSRKKKGVWFGLAGYYSTGPDVIGHATVASKVRVN
jgi:hypothetical protein